MSEPVRLQQEQALSFNLTRLLRPASKSRVELYIAVPLEMGIDTTAFSEDNYFYNYFKGSLVYYAHGLHLPLVRSRYLSKQKRLGHGYRKNLNLFCYQVYLALETDIKETLLLTEPGEYFSSARELVSQSRRLLGKLRANAPEDPKLQSYFNNADNYLSWHAEQSFLRLLSQAPGNDNYDDERILLLDYCRSENTYREDKKYNSQATVEDANRLSNKMRLLQRLIEQGVVLERRTRQLNRYIRRLVKAGVTAVIMACMMMLIINAQTSFAGFTFYLMLAAGMLYGVREIFKEDSVKLLMRLVLRGRPKWRSFYQDLSDKRVVAEQTVWLDFLKAKRLPGEVAKILARRHQQNKLDSSYLYLGFESRVHQDTLAPGYDCLQQRMVFSLAPFAKHLKQVESEIYRLNGDEITKTPVERRYQLNIVIALTSENGEVNYQRFKITLNRRRIISIDEVATP